MAATVLDTESILNARILEKGRRRSKAVKPVPFTRKSPNIPRVPIVSHGNSLARPGPYLPAKEAGKVIISPEQGMHDNTHNKTGRLLAKNKVTSVATVPGTHLRWENFYVYFSSNIYQNLHALCSIQTDRLVVLPVHDCLQMVLQSVFAGLCYVYWKKTRVKEIICVLKLEKQSDYY